MIKRDRMILEQLRQFRVMNRDQLIGLNFHNQKQPVVTCNRIMKRLTDRGYVRVNKSVLPHDYYLTETKLRPDSPKIFHFKSITDFVIEANRKGKLTTYEVEVILGDKGTIEPDLFMIWNNAPFFVEIQRYQQSNKYIADKMKKYGSYYHSGAWRNLPWQPRENPVFPYIWIVSDKPYTLPENSLKVFQSQTVSQFISKYMKKGNQ